MQNYSMKSCLLIAVCALMGACVQSTRDSLARARLPTRHGAVADCLPAVGRCRSGYVCKRLALTRDNRLHKVHDGRVPPAEGSLFLDFILH